MLSLTSVDQPTDTLSCTILQDVVTAEQRFCLSACSRGHKRWDGGLSLWDTSGHWDQQENESQTLQEGAIPIVPAQWIDLEDGIQVWFEAGSEAQPNRYRSVDYWLIPARTAIGDAEWPLVTNEQGQPVLDAQGERQSKPSSPHGIEHHYAPLAIIQVEPGGIAVSDDCRRRFSPLSI